MVTDPPIVQVLLPPATVPEPAPEMLKAPVVREALSCVAVPPPLLVSNVTVSVDPGVHEQVAPPEEVAQWLPSEKLPVPPIQKQAPPEHAASAEPDHHPNKIQLSAEPIQEWIALQSGAGLDHDWPGSSISPCLTDGASKATVAYVAVGYADRCMDVSMTTLDPPPRSVGTKKRLVVRATRQITSAGRIRDGFVLSTLQRQGPPRRQGTTAPRTHWSPSQVRPEQ